MQTQRKKKHISHKNSPIYLDVVPKHSNKYKDLQANSTCILIFFQYITESSQKSPGKVVYI